MNIFLWNISRFRVDLHFHGLVRLNEFFQFFLLDFILIDGLNRFIRLNDDFRFDWFIGVHTIVRLLNSVQLIGRIFFRQII